MREVILVCLLSLSMSYELLNKSKLSFLQDPVDPYYDPIICLEGKGDTSNPKHYIRVEGKKATLCEGVFSGRDPMEVFQQAAIYCGLTYTTGNFTWKGETGEMISSVNDELGDDMFGWIYMINTYSAYMPLKKCVLHSGDDIVLAWGFFEPSIRLYAEAFNSRDNRPIKITALASETNKDWKVVEGATVFVGETIFKTNNIGETYVSVNKPGFYRVWAEHDGMIRSNAIILQFYK
jgi:hypothetical protein